jgi:thiol-disulfide isomerase/thioredoxin
MNRLLVLVFIVILVHTLSAQTTLNEAVDFHVKTIEGESYYLFPLLDDGKIVVIDFFSTSCGPCQTYAPDFQEAYEEFGENQSNVFFMGINWGDNNAGVHEFDSVFGLTYPSVSGIQGGGNYVYEDYEILSYPTVIIITPDHQIVEQYIWPPTADSIINAVIEAGGMYVSLHDHKPVIDNALIAPNPVTDLAVLSIDINESSVVNFQLIDLLGNVLYSSGRQFVDKGNNRFNIPVVDLKNGLYFVRINSNEVHDKTVRFILAR